MEKEINEQQAVTAEVSPSEEAQVFNEMSKQMQSLKAENAALQKAKRDYYDAILNGGTISEESAPKYRTKEEIRKDLMHDTADKTNLEYLTLALELDDACIREDGKSCFLPKGKGVNPTLEEKEVAQRFHQVVQECIDYADGDPDVFNMELQRRTTETKPSKAKR